MKLESPKWLIHFQPIKKKGEKYTSPKIQHAGVLSGQLTGTSNPSIFLPWKEGAGPKQYTEDFLHKMNLWHTLPHRPATSIDSISPASVLRLDPLLEPLLWLSQMSKGDDLKARKDMRTKGKVGTKESTKKKKSGWSEIPISEQGSTQTCWEKSTFVL